MRPLGYLSPKGELYKCKQYEHLDLAYELVEKFYPDFPLRDRLQAERHLYTCGWIEIRLYEICVLYTSKLLVTKEQLDFLAMYLCRYKTNQDFKQSVNMLLHRMQIDE